VSAAELVAGCKVRGITIATAESLTAGLVSASIADVPGCSAVFRGGVVAYATDVKGSVLGLDPDDLEHVVSERVAAELARRACLVLDADLGISTTGVAGPDPLDGQEAGSVWIAVHDRTTSLTTSRHLSLIGDRASIRLDAANAAIGLASEVLGVSGT
jgi:nicotinamide-nucleotide amidase